MRWQRRLPLAARSPVAERALELGERSGDMAGHRCAPVVGGPLVQSDTHSSNARSGQHLVPRMQLQVARKILAVSLFGPVHVGDEQPAQIPPCAGATSRGRERRQLLIRDEEQLKQGGVVFGVEVVEERARRHPGPLRDLLNRHRIEAPLKSQLQGGGAQRAPGRSLVALPAVQLLVVSHTTQLHKLQLASTANVALGDQVDSNCALSTTMLAWLIPSSGTGTTRAG